MAVIKRRKPESRAKQDEVLGTQIEELKKEHPFWGYRRIWAWLNFRGNQKVNEKRVYRVMREKRLLCHRKIRKQLADRTPRSKPQADRPNQYWGTDMTKIHVEGYGWAYIVVVLDWFTKKVVGIDVATRSRSSDWLSALDQAINAQFPEGVKGFDLKLISDNGCQPTSQAFNNYCYQTGVEQIFTSYNNPKGNADTERFMRTMKEELLWLRSWTSPEDLKYELTKWTENYNKDYLHSSLGYQSPLDVEKTYKSENAYAA